MVLQLPWGLRLRRRFRADGPPAALARFLLAHAAERLAAAGAPAAGAGEEGGERWGRLVAGGFCLKSFEGPVLRWDAAAAAAAAAGGEDGAGKAGVVGARGATVEGCGVGRMEKLVVELADDAEAAG